MNDPAIVGECASWLCGSIGVFRILYFVFNRVIKKREKPWIVFLGEISRFIVAFVDQSEDGTGTLVGGDDGEALIVGEVDEVEQSVDG